MEEERREIICSEISEIVAYLCPQIIEIERGKKNTYTTIVVFLEVGEQVEIVGNDLFSTINQAVSEAQNTTIIFH